MTALDWLIVLVLNGGVIVYGFRLSRGTSTPQEWFLGKRSLAWWTIGLSMLATNVDNADLVSLTGTSFREGFHIIGVHTLGALAGGIIAAFFLLPALIKAGHFTNAEYLEARFGLSTRILSALIQIQYRTSLLGLMLWSIYLLLTKFLGLEPALAWAAVAGLVALAAVYATWGGLRAVVFTDAAQAVIMFLGTGAVFWAVARAAGGGALAAALERGPGEGVPAAGLARMSQYFGDDGATSPWVVLAGWIIIGSGYWTVNHTQTMRLLGARSVWDMKMAALFGVALSMPIMVACSAIGVFGQALFPDFEPPDALYPHLAGLYLGAGLKGLVVAGIVAAAISTFDSMGSSLSAVFTRDIYARLLVRDRDDAHYLRAARWATLGILALGFAYLPFIMSKDTMLKAFLTLIPVFVTPLFTIYLIGVFTRAPARAGLLGILCGSSYGLLALWDREVADIAWLAPWFTGRWAALSWSMGFTLLGGLAATAIWGLAPASGTPGASRPRPGGWLERSSASLGELPAHPFAGRGVPLPLRPPLVAAVLAAAVLFAVFRWFW